MNKNDFLLYFLVLFFVSLAPSVRAGTDEDTLVGGSGSATIDRRLGEDTFSNNGEDTFSDNGTGEDTTGGSDAASGGEGGDVLNPGAGTFPGDNGAGQETTDGSGGAFVGEGGDVLNPGEGTFPGDNGSGQDTTDGSGGEGIIGFTLPESSNDSSDGNAKKSGQASWIGGSVVIGLIVLGMLTAIVYFRNQKQHLFDGEGQNEEDKNNYEEEARLSMETNEEITVVVDV